MKLEVDWQESQSHYKDNLVDFRLVSQEERSSLIIRKQHLPSKEN